MQISRLLLSFFTLSNVIFSVQAMENKGKSQRDRRRDRISRAFKGFTIRPGRGESPPSEEGPGAEESSVVGTMIIQPRAPKNSVETLPHHLLMNARSQAGVPQPPAPSMLGGSPDMQNLTGSPPKDDVLYAPIELSETGQLTPTEQSPPTPQHMSPEDANRPDEYGRTPLSAAVMRGNVEEFRALLASGATTNFRRSGNTLLHEAAMSRNSSSEIVRLLVEEYGQDPNALSEGGQAPLHLAAHSGTLDMFNVLVQLPNSLLDIRSKKIDCLSRDEKAIRETPLHILAAGRRRQASDMAQILLQPGTTKTPADPCATNAYSKTPLEIAIQTKSEPMVRLLLHHTPLGHESVKQAYAACTSDTIKALFEERSDVPKPSPYARTTDLPNGDKAQPSSSDSDDTDGERVTYVDIGDLFRQ